MQYRSRLGALLGIVCAPAALAITVSVVPSRPSQLPIGERQTFTASVADASSGEVWYRFRVRSVPGEFRLVRDFAPSSSIEWTTLDGEGDYEIQVTARTSTNPAESLAIVTQSFTSRVTDGQPAVNPTENPLIWIFSAPPCSPGSLMYVEYSREGGQPQVSSPRACDGVRSANFYVAGLRSASTYTARGLVESGSRSSRGSSVVFQTPDVDETQLFIPTRRLIKAPSSPAYEGVVLNSPIQSIPYATDLEGNLLWYYPKSVGFIGRPSLGGTFTAISWTTTPVRSDQVAREFDIAGTTLWETNAAIMSERLRARGLPPTSGFHHEAFRLPDGYILLLASVEKRVPELGNKNVMGDLILVVDNEMNIVWTWNSFDHLDVKFEAVLGEDCLNNGACPPVFDGTTATDWLHTNSVQYTSDGNLLLSVRHLDWAVKIDYRDRLGTGAVLWRLGKGGDFQLESSDPYPWFSHQHDVAFLPGSNSLLLVFDNGNTRREVDATANSRGQLYQLDQAAMKARFVLNADLGGYSFALGSAQKLRNGNYHFNNGWTIPRPGEPTSTATEVDSSGKIVYSLQSGAAVYRSFRMEDILTP
jgi:arylsulfate sulfotransferase